MSVVHHHRSEPVRGSTELFTSQRHLPSCWTSEGFYGTTYATGGFPPISSVASSNSSYFFPSHVKVLFLPPLGWRALEAVPHAPIQKLVALRPRNFVCACCQTWVGVPRQKSKAKACSSSSSDVVDGGAWWIVGDVAVGGAAIWMWMPFSLRLRTSFISSCGRFRDEAVGASRVARNIYSWVADDPSD